MPKSKTYRGGNPFPLSYVNSSYREPSAPAGSNVPGAQVGLARAVLNPTGGRRYTRSKTRPSKTKPSKTRRNKMSGGFYPSVMGNFIENAARLIPAVIYSGYKYITYYNKSHTRKKSR